MTTPEFHLFLPQMRMDPPTLVAKARAAEAAGFDGLALMDHLAPPMAEAHPMHDAIVTATWLAAHTERLTISHLVLCDAFRHPAVLAKQAVGIDHCSGGRFELGLGWGSVPAELATFGVGTTENRPRFDRLLETIEVVKALWSGEAVSFAGEYHHIEGGMQQPTPTREIPLVIGGGGPRTMRLVAEHATWWNCPGYALDRFDELRQKAGSARVSIQQMAAFVPEEAARAEVEAVTARRFGHDRHLILGTAEELAEAYRGLHERGVDRFYVWLTDFAAVETLEAFGAGVIAPLRS